MTVDAETRLLRETLKCSCGCETLSRFSFTGDDVDSDDPGLRLLFTCSKCGEQLRLYQTSDSWRDARATRAEAHELRAMLDKLVDLGDRWGTPKLISDALASARAILAKGRS